MIEKIRTYDPQDPVELNTNVCPVWCSEGDEWIACDSCNMWYHQNCVSIPLSSCDNIADINWVCQACVSVGSSVSF